MVENDINTPYKCCLTMFIIFLIFTVSFGAAFIILMNSYSCPKNNYMLYGSKLCTAIPNNTFDATPDCFDSTKLVFLSVIICWVISWIISFKIHSETKQNIQTQNI